MDFAISSYLRSILSSTLDSIDSIIINCFKYICIIHVNNYMFKKLSF